MRTWFGCVVLVGWRIKDRRLIRPTRPDSIRSAHWRRYGWTQHDGRSYGRQAIDDAVHGVQLTTEYARLDDGGRYWATRVHAEPAAVESGDGDDDEDEGEEGRSGSTGRRFPAAVYLYLAVDCDGSVPTRLCLDAAGGRGLDLQIDRNPGLAAGAYA